MSPPRMRHFRDLPLIARLLIPFLALMLLVGGFGIVLIVRDLSARARVSLEQDLSRRLLEARSSLRDRELYLVESANFASNIEGVAARLRARDAESVARLMHSVLALKTDLHLLAVIASDGRGVVEFARREGREGIVRAGTRSWLGHAFVEGVLSGRNATKSSGLVEVDGRTLVAIAAPICPPAATCVPDGVAVVGIDVRAVVTGAAGSGAEKGTSRGVAIYDTGGDLVERFGAAVEQSLPVASGNRIAQRTRDINGSEAATAYAPMELQGRRTGTLAVTVPTAPAFASARGTGMRLALIVVAVMAGIVALGALLSRSILAQVRPLVATNRALGKGDLSARTLVRDGGELGELARGVNQMAEQLQAIYADLERRVEERTEEVRRLLKERTEFFASISHELRTPLAVILGQGRMMLDPKYPKNQRWASRSGRTVVDTTSQLITTVNEILDLARAEAGRLEMTIEEVDVAHVLRELLPSFQALARADEVHLTVVQPIESAVVRADRRRLHGILTNLVDNALKYTEAGGSVAITVSASEAFVEVAVSDTGVGIPPESGDMIFEPFYRVPGAPLRAGRASSGLGLALCKRLVEAQGGTIRFNSEPGRGSTFAFRLPAAPQQKHAPIIAKVATKKGERVAGR